jgi:homoserine dehydrogenase
VEGWDSAAKTAALANVLMNAHTTPQQVTTRGITRLTPERLMEIARDGKTVRLVSRGRRTSGGVSLRVRAEVLERNDMLACTPGTSNLILFHTDLMGTFGTVSIEPGVEQTAYGVFSDLVSSGVSGSQRRTPDESDSSKTWSAVSSAIVMRAPTLAHDRRRRKRPSRVWRAYRSRWQAS